MKTDALVNVALGTFTIATVTLTALEVGEHLRKRKSRKKLDETIVEVGEVLKDLISETEINTGDSTEETKED